MRIVIRYLIVPLLAFVCGLTVVMVALSGEPPKPINPLGVQSSTPTPQLNLISTGKVVMPSPPSALDYTAPDGMSQTNAPKVLESVKAAVPQPTFTDGVRIATVMARRNPDVIDLRAMWQMCYQVWQMEQQQAAKGAK